MIVTKLATDVHRHRRPFLYYSAARVGLRDVLRVAGVGKGDRILLPAYVGWSPREGCGVLDPIQDLTAECIFYSVSSNLQADLDDFDAKIVLARVRALLIIHYFGWVDPHTQYMATKARELGILVIEDEAHAFLSDAVSGLCGRFGDVALVSLHKLFPVRSGGAVLLNPTFRAVCRTQPAFQSGAGVSPSVLDHYDLRAIATCRRRNATILMDALSAHVDQVAPLYGELPEGVIPQTFPVVVRNASRDVLYHRMNQAGYGVVSLYHTLVDVISQSEFPVSHSLSSAILNLPVHQDAHEAALRGMVDTLAAVLHDIAP